jgi:hypothetical protein
MRMSSWTPNHGYGEKLPVEVGDMTSQVRCRAFDHEEMTGDLEACVSLAAVDRGFFSAKKGNLHDQEAQEDPLAKSETDQLFNTKKLAQVEYLEPKLMRLAVVDGEEIPNPMEP